MTTRSGDGVEPSAGRGVMPPDRSALERHFVAISQAHLIATFLGLIAFVALVLLFFLRVDPDLFFASDRLALKIGGTVLTLPQLRTLQMLAGPEGMKLSGGEFAERITETILLAEAARQRHLDRDPEYLDRVKAFDRSISPASETQDLSRALFLIEALARRMRQELWQQAADEIAVKAPPAASASAGSLLPEKLHVRTILVETPEKAGQVLALISAGSSFPQINAEWSRSPYATVNGDQGWITSLDLPDGVFERLAEVPVGSLTIGFADGAGVHLFLVEEKLQPRADQVRRSGKDLLIRHREAELLHDFLRDLRRSIPVWMHPTLVQTRS